MTVKAQHIFVNLPVKDLNKTKEFFTSIGFEFNEQYSDDKAACLVIGENIYAMLLLEQFFQSFTNQPVTDTETSREVIIAISADSRVQVDEIVTKAIEAGGKPANDPMDHGFMYSWSFQDVDGHLWEVLYMEQKN
ncbi:VOC family protein [Halalkalibacterium halodurans]|uniref:BH3119 protein n=2 Tax=Halalkalibacterium halodurans TaxID=86665 RepID=Q9K887_HALH5|nr:VOC family protein [Halalkalibacterium halodurans]MED4082102.1 VOC family protein [Halalkalibacterium halodurans]MED4084320.1 VOC family protein [Halalkalibacterium halodurans]MED4103629.1 VOC family protein [Halalkalibacterium halodurans]MED4107596.1 VOC family protein [Halalkalibacterium halodurans]MED4126017.1 VOC family protein [Halalkalibacterium halodurans]